MQVGLVSCFKFLVVITTFASLLSACGGGGGGGDSSSSTQFVQVSGKVQKGPFVDLQVSAFGLDDQGQQIDEYDVRIGDGGSYSFRAPAQQLVSVRASGTYIDETSGQERRLAPEQALKSVFTPSGAPQNINILTDLAASHFLGQVEAPNDPPLSAKEQAQESERFVASQLGFPNEQALGALDLEQVESTQDPDFLLLTLSAGLLDASPADEGLPQQLQNVNTALSSGLNTSSLGDLFNGIDAARVLDQLQDAAVIPLPDLNLEQAEVILCEPICGLVSGLESRLSVTGTSLHESQGRAELVISRTGSEIGELTLSYTVTETSTVSARANADFVAETGSVTLPAGDTRVTVPVEILTDPELEGAESFQVAFTLLTDSSITFNRSVANVTILDGLPVTANASSELETTLTACILDVDEVATLQQNRSDDPDCSVSFSASRLLTGTPPDAALVNFELDALCPTEATPACQAANAWPLVLEWVVLDSTDTVLDTAAAGSVLLTDDDLLAGAGASGDRYADSRVVSLVDPSVRRLLAGAFLQDQQVQLRVRSNSDFEPVVQEVSSNVPELVPVSDGVQFGNRSLSLVSAPSFLESSTCVSGSGGIAYDLTGTYAYTLSIEDQSVDVELSGDICVSAVASANGEVDLVVEEADINLAGFSLPLPENHYSYLSLGTSLLEPQRAAPVYPVLPVSSGGDSGGSALVARAYLSSETLPFGLRITGGRLTEEGIVLDYSEADLEFTVPYEASDPRVSALQSNSIQYKNLASGSLLLEPTGIHASLSFLSGAGATAWPRGDLSWQSFNLDVLDGQLADHQINADFSLKQNQSCSSLSCVQGVAETHRVSALLNIDSQGTAVGAATVSEASNLAWGALDQSNAAWSIQDGLQVGASANLVLPGFQQTSLASAADGLAANRSESVLLHRRYLPGSQDFISGNGYAPGLNVGPEWYSGPAGQPDLGSGQDWSGKTLELITPGGSLESFESHLATKYVLQNAGVTGVINVEPSTLPQTAALSGYNVSFERFAVRTLNNINDDYNWVDGALSLGGDAGLAFAFDNLALSCDGAPGAAVLKQQVCDGPCLLESWRAEIDVYELAFERNAEQCSLAAPQLALSHEILFKALDQPLAMRTRWNNGGYLQSSEIQRLNDYVFDSREGTRGYPLLVSDATLDPAIDISSPESIRYGTLSLEAQVGVPFWSPIDADIRVANTLNVGAPEAESSVVLPMGSFAQPAYATLREQLNQELQAEVVQDDQFDLKARYEWGNTGFGFTLPVYYDVASTSQDVSFLGRRVERDLFVLEAGAGVDFITPAQTKLSFGASADFARLKQARFQVDLSDPEGLKKVDELLIQAQLISDPVITPVLDQVSKAAAKANRFAGRGIDELMEELLLNAVKGAGEAAIPAMPNQRDPFETLSEGMARVRNYPNQLINAADDYVFDPINKELNQQEARLRASLLALVTEVETLDPGEELSQELKARLEEVRAQLNQANQVIDQAFSPIDSAFADIASQIAQVQGVVNEMNAAREEVAQIVSEVTSVVANQCQIQGSVLGSESAGYLDAAFQQIGSTRELVSLLAGSDALASLADLLIDDAALKETIADTQDTLKEGAEELLNKIAEAETALRAQLCQGDVTSLLAQVNRVLLEIETHTNQLQTLIQDVTTGVDYVERVVTSIKSQVLQPLAVVTASLNELERETHSALEPLSGDVLVARVNNTLASDDTIPFNSLVAREADETDLFSVSFSTVRTQVNNVRNQFVSDLKQQTDGLLPYGNFSADQLRRNIVKLVMDAEPVRRVREELNTRLVEIVRKANSQILVLTDQANMLVSQALSRVENEVNAVLEDATAAVRDIPLDAAKIDGFGLIAGNELEQAHIDAEWTMSSSDETEPGNTFGASLDASRWSANGKAEGCAAPGAASNLDITIAAMGIPASIGESDITLKKVSLGFTLGEGNGDVVFVPLGVNGGLSTTGEIGFTEFIVYDPAFAAGIGAKEVYLGASAGAVFSDIQAEVAFLLGKTCNQDVLLELDPKVAQFIPIPATGFTGAYVRGAASIPVYTNGCPLTVGVAADMGAWVLKGPPLTAGGLIGGGAYGKVGCVGALRGQLRALGQFNSNGDISFVGDGFGAAGAGLCEPAGWTSVERSREDDLCGTADARFTAGYQNGWSVINLSLGAIY